MRPASRLILHTVAAAVAAATIVFAAVAWRLASGPVPLTFLKPYVEDALRQTDSPYRVQFADIILTWAGWDRTLDIRLIDVWAVGADGSVAAAAPEVSLGFSVPAMLRGTIAPTHLEIIEPSLYLIRNADGRIELGFGKSVETATDASDFLLADLLAPPDRSRAMGYLDRVSVVGADLVIDDRRLGLSWHAPRATISFERHDDGIGARAVLDLEIAGHEAMIEAQGRYTSADGRTRLRVDFSDVWPEWLAEGSDKLASLAAARLPVSGSVDVVLDSEGTLSEIVYDLSAGAGSIILPQWLDEPVDIRIARAKGTFVVGLEQLHIDDGFVDLGGPKVWLDGMIEGFGAAPVVGVGITLRELPLDDLARYWPETLAPAAREWITTNLTDGMIGELKSSIRIGPGDLQGDVLPDEAVVTTIGIEGATVHYLSPLPPLSGVDGTVTITGRKVEIVTSGGALGNLRAGQAKLLIGDLGGDGRMSIEIPVSGPIADALGLLNHPYLDYTQALGIDPSDVAGDAEVRLRFEFPLHQNLRRDQVAVAVEARLREARIAGTFEGFEVGNGSLDLTLDETGIDIAGTVTLNGIPAAVTWRENLLPDAPQKRRFTIKGSFTDSQRLGLGLPGNDYIAGPADIEMEIIETPGEPRHLRVTAGLSAAMMRIPEIHWNKPPGIDGILTVSARQTADAGTIVDRFELAAADLAATGSITLDPASGELRRLDLARLEVGDTSVQATVAAMAGGGYQVAIGGTSLDLRPYLDDALTGGETPWPPFEVTAKLQQVITRKDHAFGAVDAALRLVNGRWEWAVIDGELPGGKRLSLRLSRGENGRTMWMGSDDGGAVLRAFDIFDNAVGGKLVLTANLDAGDSGGVAVGKLKIADFKLVNAPMLAKVLSVASITGIFELLQDKGLPFTKLVIPYTKQGDVLEIGAARAYGPALGFTVTGKIDLGADTVSLNGTVAPASILNRVFGKLPLLGDILVGPEHGGLFAATYKIKGPLADPEITVNPLAALAPGLLRSIFTYTSEDTGEVEPFEPLSPDASR